MKLLNMKLENFKGIRHLEIPFDGIDREFRGTNAAGKTTIADAQSWLLTGKKFSVNENLNPKTWGPDGEYMHNLEHSVECKYQNDDGSIVTLKKIFKEKYTKKRGSTRAEFSGHVVEYYIDDVPTKEKDFNDFLVNMFGSVENIQILSNINYFANMDWKKRRKILLEMCGDYDDDYIISDNPYLFELKSILLKEGTSNQYYTVEEFMKMTKERMKKTNTDIQAIPARIDEATRAIPDVSGIDKNDLLMQLDMANGSVDKLKSEKMQLDSSNDQERLKQERIHDVQMEIKNARVSFIGEYAEKNQEFNSKLNSLKSDIRTLEDNKSSKERRVKSAESDLNYMNTQRQKLIDQYNQVRSKEWDTSKEVCPTCGRELPSDKIEELKSKFNIDKSKELEDINRRGQSVSKDAIQEQQSQIDKIKKEIEIIGTDIILKKQELSRLESERPASVTFESTETYRILNQKLMDAQSIRVDDQNAARKIEIDSEISSIQDSINELQLKIGLFGTVDYQNKRINELKNLQKQLSVSYEKMESQIYLCEEFIKSKVNMITQNINKHYKNVSFRLFETQINGGLKECCDVMVPAHNGVYVPFGDGSNLGANMNAGLEMVDVYSRYLGVSIPVFVDNSESVVDLQEYDGLQVIKLVVDGNYNNLTMTK